MVLAPFVAVAVALLCLLVALALTVVFTPIIEGMLRQLPLVGSHLAEWTRDAIAWARAPIIRAANSTVDTVRDWLLGWRDSIEDFVAATNAYLVELPARLDHLTHVTVHDIVKAFVNPVRAIATAAKDDAGYALAGVLSVFALPLNVFKGIEGDVAARLDHLRDVIKNVDLPELQRVFDQSIGGAVDVVEGEIAGLADFTDKEFDRVWTQLGQLPLDKLLALLREYPALAALVGVIALEAGLDNVLCRRKVKHICTTDVDAWEALLDVAGIALAWMGLREFVQLAQDFARETVPTVMGLVHGD